MGFRFVAMRLGVQSCGFRVTRLGLSICILSAQGFICFRDPGVQALRALIVKIGFGVFYTLSIITNPEHPIPFINAHPKP